ncbi:MAG: hypothetical protein ABR987_00460 [Terracidiphilus sp.]
MTKKQVKAVEKALANPAKYAGFALFHRLYDDDWMISITKTNRTHHLLEKPDIST